MKNQYFIPATKMLEIQPMLVLCVSGEEEEINNKSIKEQANLAPKIV